MGFRFGWQVIAGADGVDQGQPNQCRQSGDQKEVGKSAHSHPAQPLQIAHLRHPQGKAGEDQGDDHHDQHIEENFSQRITEVFLHRA